MHLTLIGPSLSTIIYQSLNIKESTSRCKHLIPKFHNKWSLLQNLLQNTPRNLIANPQHLPSYPTGIILASSINVQFNPSIKWERSMHINSSCRNIRWPKTVTSPTIVLSREFVGLFPSMWNGSPHWQSMQLQEICIVHCWQGLQVWQKV